MRINAIGSNNFYTLHNNKSNAVKKNNSSPSFSGYIQYDYDNKPVPPAGKAVAAASVMALISAMIYTARCDNFRSDDNKAPIENTNDSVYYDSNYRPSFEYSDQQEDNSVKEKGENEIQTEDGDEIQKEETPDSLLSDSVRNTQHKTDSVAKTPKEVIGHFNGAAYKVVSKGDTVVLIPVVPAHHSTEKDSVFAK